MAWLGSLGAWGAALLGRGGPTDEQEEVLLAAVRRNLDAGSPGPAWTSASQLLEVSSQSKRPLGTDGWVTVALAALAAGRLTQAVSCLDEAAVAAAAEAATDEPALHDEKVAGVAALATRAKQLLAQSWGEHPPPIGPAAAIAATRPPAALPQAWASMVAGMPVAAEYVGPVLVRTPADAEAGAAHSAASAGPRLVTARRVRTGEVLMVAYPFASAPSREAALSEAAIGASSASLLAAQRLASLLEAFGEQPRPGDATLEALRASEDSGFRSSAADARRPETQRLAKARAFRDPRGSFHLYGLPSLLSHTCDGGEANTLTSFVGPPTATIIVQASREIEEGEELRVHRFSPEGPLRSRREQAASIGLDCKCARCTFEAERLVGTPVVAAIDEAIRLFKGKLQEQMRVLAQGGGDQAGRWAMLQESLQAIRTVERLASEWEGCGTRERAWILALILPLFNVALWCVFSGAAAELEVPEGIDALGIRCEVLRHIVAAWQHTQPHGADHLRNLYLLCGALREARLREVAKASDACVVRPPPDPGTPPWSRMEGADFHRAVEARGLHSVVLEAGGFLQVLNVFPEDRARATLEVLRSLGDEDWEVSANKNSVDASHKFLRYEGDKVEDAKLAFRQLGPHLFPVFNAARYDAGGGITLHNDAKSWVVRAEEARGERYPAGVTVYRKVALIWYLTEDWKEEYGGCLVDNVQDEPVAVVPQFNSLIAFLVPREHWVTKVTEGAPQRFTVFGWLCDTDPYPSEALLPLGSGNPRRPGDGRWHGAQEREQAVAPALRSPAVASAAAAAAEARVACEAAFSLCFGVDADALRVDAPDSQVPHLLRALRDGWV